MHSLHPASRTLSISPVLRPDEHPTPVPCLLSFFRQDIYFPRSKYQGNIDGAYFGTTFPHLFLMTYGYLKPQKCTVTYVPRIFGFKVSDGTHKTYSCVLLRGTRRD